MQTKKENFWFMFRMLLLMNAVLVTVIVLAHSHGNSTDQKPETCGSAKKANADIVNAITVKLM